MKKLTNADLKTFRDRLYLPITDKQIDESEVAPFFHPGKDAPEIEYMMERRRQLGGSLPKRVNRSSCSSCPATRSTPSSSRAPASRPSPPPWRWSGCCAT